MGKGLLKPIYPVSRNDKKRHFVKQDTMPDRVELGRLFLVDRVEKHVRLEPVKSLYEGSPIGYLR